jgi:hypothetical protein
MECDNKICRWNIEGECKKSGECILFYKEFYSPERIERTILKRSDLRRMA